MCRAGGGAGPIPALPCYPLPHAPYMPQGHSSAADGTVTTMASENQPQPAPNRNTKMLSSGWKALEQWGDDVARIEPLAGGVANDVWSVRVNGHLAVGRLGARSDADLAWETELLQHLDREGQTVPAGEVAAASDAP